MLWNKRKPSDPSRAGVAAPDAAAETSAVRSADPDRALDAVGSLLKAYGRFAFDTEQAAASVREQCEHWAQRIVLGEGRRQQNTQDDDGTSLLRDWHGLHHFFDAQRKQETEYVTRSLGGLRSTVLALARCLGGGAGEDQESDAQVERGLQALARAVAQGDVVGVSKAASAVIESARGSMQQRRTREARHTAELGERLRALQDDLSVGLKNAVLDEVTGLLGPAAYEQQLDQLSALGMLLEQRPWLAVIEIGKSGSSRPTVDDAALREVSKVVSRTFLRKEDFIARSGAKEFAVMIADMTEEQLAAAFDRLLLGIQKLAEGRRRGDAPTVAIGLARARSNEEATSWRSRAELALDRAKQDGGGCYQILR
jgi:diguanylate cyclase (GGDEF)-like protein